MNHCLDKEALEDLFNELTNLGSWPGCHDFEAWYQERFGKQIARHERNQARKASACGLTKLLGETE